MGKKHVKRRSIYLYHGNDDYCSAMFGVGPAEGPKSKTRAYNPTRASAWRLARIMERILDNKQFYLTIVAPRSLHILFGSLWDHIP